MEIESRLENLKLENHNTLNRKLSLLTIFLILLTVYTNGQREGIISERPFKVGDSISKERAALESLAESFPLLDVDAEVKMASEARNVCQDRMATKTMKHMGLQRYSTFPSSFYNNNILLNMTNDPIFLNLIPLL